MNNNILNLRHVGIVVRELDAALDFWTRIMGFKIQKKMNEKGAHIDSITMKEETKVTTIKLSGPDSRVVELLKFENDELNYTDQVSSKTYSYGITHIAFEVNNIDKEYSRLLNEGIEFNSPPNLTPDGGAKMNYFKAHDGVYIELVQLLI